MTPATISSAWLREHRPTNGVLPIDAETAQVLADALEIADESERCLIECNCFYTGDGAERTYDIFPGSYEDYERDAIARAVRYLEARGLIGREGELVRFVGAAG